MENHIFVTGINIEGVIKFNPSNFASKIYHFKIGIEDFRKLLSCKKSFFITTETRTWELNLNCDVMHKYRTRCDGYNNRGQTCKIGKKLYYITFDGRVCFFDRLT
jgi:hypothetical protein